MKSTSIFVVAMLLLLGAGSVYAACGTCNWYGTNWPVCCNQNTAWGWENSASCIGCTVCTSAGQSCSSCTKCGGGGTTTTTTGGSCTITPYIQVNDGSWQQTSSVTVSSGAKVKFGPQPLSGTYSWSGCGTSGSSREQTVYPTSSCTATATLNGSCSRSHSVTVSGGGSTTTTTTGGGSTTTTTTGGGGSCPSSVSCPTSSSCGCYTVSGLGSNKTTLRNAGGSQYMVASAMMETELMNTNYSTCDGKSGDSCCCGVTKMNFYAARTSGCSSVSSYSSWCSNVNGSRGNDVTCWNRIRSYFGSNYWAVHRNGQSGLSNPNTTDIQNFKKVNDWTNNNIGSHLSDNVRFWSNVPAI